MKKVLLLSVLILLAGGTAFALDISLVPKVGAGVGMHTGDDWQTFLDQDPPADNSVRFAYSAGAFLDIGLIPALAIQAGAAFGQTGGGYSVQDSDVNGTTTFTMIEVPLLLRPRFVVGTGSLYLLAGPAAFFLLGDLTQDEDGTEVSAFEPDNRVVWAGAAGLGYSFPVGGGNALVELKYSRSFSEFTDGDDTRLNNLYLQLGYALPLLGFPEG